MNLATDALRKRSDLRRLGMAPDGDGRPAITGRGGDSVWDFIPLRAAKRTKQFTLHPHLTMSVERTYAEAMITLPHGARPDYRRRLIALGRSGFVDLAVGIFNGLRPVVRRAGRAVPRMYATQRHYPSQRASAITDARVELDLRTVLPKGRDGVRHEPQWLDAVYEVLLRKRSNIQLGIGARFPYGSGPIQSAEALDLVAGAWVGCRRC